MAGSCCLWYYSRRYVGEMSLMLPDAQRVRFSVLDFWGNREVSVGWGVLAGRKGRGLGEALER